MCVEGGSERRSVGTTGGGESEGGAEREGGKRGGKEGEEGVVTFLCLFDSFLSPRFGNRLNLHLLVPTLPLHVQTNHVPAPSAHFAVLVGLGGIC